MSIFDIPSETFSLPPLYRIDANGKTTIWTVSFDGSRLITNWGPLEEYKQGRFRSTDTEVVTNQSGRNLYEQAMLEAVSKRNDKINKSGYHEYIQNTIVSQTTLNIRDNIFTEDAMLATTWDPTKTQIKRWPVWVQPKLDGIRCRSHTTDGHTVVLNTRTKGVIHNLDHIRKDLLILYGEISKVLREFFPTMEPIFRTDGELYTTQLPFERINGISRLVKSRDPQESLIEYHIFDLVIPQNVTYDVRWGILQRAFNHTGWSLRFLNSYSVSTPEEILSAHNMFVLQGYEGVIIRKVGGSTAKEMEESYYYNRRCTAIYKYKSFLDSEFTIVGAESATGTEEGAVVWTLVTDNGIKFSCRPRSSIESRRELYNHRDRYIGKKYRCRYQELSEYGVPRFPVGIDIIEDR